MRLKDKYEFLKGALSGLREFSATESPLKMMKNVYMSSQKLFSFSRYLILDFFFMYQNGLITKIRFISNFMMPQPG